MPNEPQIVTPPVLDATTVANFLVGVFLPLAIAWLRSNRATSRYAAGFSFAVAVAVSLVITVLAKAFVGQWSADAMENARLVILNIATLLMVSWNTFARLWQPIGLTGKLEQSGPQLGSPQP